MVDLNYNFECDWLIELSDNNLASELVENRSFFTPITIEEIVIFMINIIIIYKNNNSLLPLLLQLYTSNGNREVNKKKVQGYWKPKITNGLAACSPTQTPSLRDIREL